MAHIDNIPYIDNTGFVHRDSPLALKDYVSIGDASMIDARSRKIMYGGHSLDEFIPFYFGPRSPMLYEIQHGYNNVTKRSPEDIVYCVVRLKDLKDSGLRFCFTDGHAMNAITEFYDGGRINDIDSLVSYDDVYAYFWNSNPDEKRKKEAELLLLDELPPQLIAGYVVYGESARNRLLQFGISEERIKINKNYYFPL